MANPELNLQALKSDVRAALINQKAFACPIAVRVAWHASGTYDASDDTGGSDGATMRFEPEISDGANAGLHIVRDMLLRVHKKYPAVSMADLWTYAGAVAIEFMGGPKIPHRFGRTDAQDGSGCPAHGRLPDAEQGAQHLRDVFHRMGLSDQEIVALSGAHTVGRCHAVRSGFDGPWTLNPLEFDNAYFTNLIEETWTAKTWDGPLQYTDAADTLMMLPTDLALIQDEKFRVHVERYAADQAVFFEEFAAAYGKLLALGCEPQCQPGATSADASDAAKHGASFREAAMHGSLYEMRRLADKVDVHEVENNSGRTALHKAAYWGHIEAIRYLANDLKLALNATDHSGDTALHDAVRFGHDEVAQILIDAGTDIGIKNDDGQTALDVAVEYGKDSLAAVLRG